MLGNVGTHAHNQMLYKNPLYHAANDFAPVGLIVDLPVVMVTRKDLPPNNLQEFIAYAKANQATMNYSSGGAGSSSHLACALLNAAIGVKVTHVPYRGGGPATGRPARRPQRLPMLDGRDHAAADRRQGASRRSRC